MTESKRYFLHELLDACDSAGAHSVEVQAWLDLVPVGLENELPDAESKDHQAAENRLGS